MGCGPSKNDSLAVQEATGMSKKEVAEAFKGFKKEAGGAKVKLDKFTKLLQTMNTNKGGEVGDFAQHLFRALDTDKDNLVSFKEVMVGFHNLSANGDQKEKLRLVFKIFDVSCSKFISKDEVRTITKAQYKLEGRPLDERDINQKVEQLFNQCDLNADGKISEEEFIKSGSSIAEMFELETEE